MSNNHHYLIYNAQCIDPENGGVFDGSIFIQNGIIADIIDNALPDLTKYPDMTHINAAQNYLSPGFIDISVGVGGIHSDNFGSLSQAALRGGVTSVIIEPNISPTIDTPATCSHILNTAKQQSEIHVYVAACLTKDHASYEMAPLGLLKQAGAVALSFTDKAIDNNLLLYRSLCYASSHNMLVSLYPEDNSLANNGIAHEGFVSSLYGLDAHPIEAETLGLERDLMLADKANAKLHIQQISTRYSLDIIQRYKDNKTDVTVSCSLQHIALNEHDIIPYRTFLKMRPPLRTEDDRQALSDAVCRGDIDIVTSSHRPRLDDVKRLPYGEAEFGCASIENMLSVLLNLYYGQSEYNLAEILKCVTLNPAKRFDLPAGRLKIGNPADLIIFNADQGYRMTRDTMKSTATNTPYDGQLMQGVVTHVFINGNFIQGL
ncbi:MAG: dihydroorotase [Alphaproteobacteria bacterium]|jgi:dihydroorotase